MKTRELWIDWVRGIACALVALGHLFQSMYKAGLASETGVLAQATTIFYYFHVPLFFFASGFLHQKTGGKGWQYVFKRAINFIVPCAFFFDSNVFFKPVVFSRCQSGYESTFMGCIVIASCISLLVLVHAAICSHIDLYRTSSEIKCTHIMRCFINTIFTT